MAETSTGRDGYDGLVSRFDDILSLLSPDEQAALASIIAVAGERLGDEDDVGGFVMPGPMSPNDAYARQTSAAHRDRMRDAVVDLMRKLSEIKGLY